MIFVDQQGAGDVMTKVIERWSACRRGGRRYGSNRSVKPIEVVLGESGYF